MANMIIKRFGRIFFSVEQKRQMLKFINRLKGKQDDQVDLLKTKLLEHGFFERAVSDLIKLLNGTNKVHIKKLAAWELVYWFANYKNVDGAACCLKYLPVIMDNAESAEEKRKATIMQAECCQVMGKTGDAEKLIMNEIALNPHPDLYLAAANLESLMPQKIGWINKALEAKEISRIKINPSSDLSPYDRLNADYSGPAQVDTGKDQPKVTVIIPACNSAGQLPTALNSILAQTWSNLEVLVVDDCSSDATPEVTREYQKKDKRVKLLTTSFNSGAYVARNVGLKAATGDLVTTNDADDWSHPQKIETQVVHLLQNPKVLANMSEQVRSSDNLEFYRRGTYGNLIFSNKSSLMFHRKPVMEVMGYWDSVRFAADTEFIYRLRNCFGSDAVVQLKTGPLSFQRQTETSLTGSNYYGFFGYHAGARKEYLESHAYYQQKKESNYYSFPLTVRPFPIPEPMWTQRENKPSGWREFDVVLASDYRFGGDTLQVNIIELEGYKNKGLRVGLVQMYQYDCNYKSGIHKKVRTLIDGNKAQVLVYGERVSCKQLLVLHPAVLQERQYYIPSIRASEVGVLLKGIKAESGRQGSESCYNLKQFDQLLQEYFGQPGVWYPLNSKVREELRQYSEQSYAGDIYLSPQDWSFPC